MNAFVSKQHQTLEQSKTKVEGDDTLSEEQKATLAAAQNQANALAKANVYLDKSELHLELEMTRILSLSSQAADGLVYKTKITEQACGAGVLALSEAFNTEAP